MQNGVSGAPLISVVIPSYNGAAYLEACLRSLQRQTYKNAEILVIDNASQDSSIEIIKTVAPEAIILIQSSNRGFAGGVNAGIQAARGEWIAVLNNDTEAAPDWLEQCVSAMSKHPEAAFLACRVLDSTDRNVIYSAGDCVLRGGIGYRRGQSRRDSARDQRDIEICAPCGCAAIYRTSVIQAFGGFDEHFFAYLEDVELGLRLRAAGQRGFYVAQAVVFHQGGGTSGGEFSSLAVRLRTRNSLLLILKSLPIGALWKWSPMIMATQLSWLLRVLSRGKLASYLRGLVSVFPLVPAMLQSRSRMRRLWGGSSRQLRELILQSESMAKEDFCSTAEEWPSVFLKWYFRFF